VKGLPYDSAFVRRYLTGAGSDVLVGPESPRSDKPTHERVTEFFSER
jgi:hypothetical protein